MRTAVGVIGGAADESLEALTQAVVGRREGLPWLLEAARDGNGDAFAALVRRFQGPVYHFVLRMVRRPAVAEDLSQEVFIRLWRHLGSLDSAEVLSGWLRRVAANAVIDHWRKEDARKRKLSALREHPVARRAVRPAGRMETRETADAVRAAVASLSPKLRSVLMLRAMEGLRYEELADVLGISVNAVRSRLFRARQELHEELKRQRADVYLARMFRKERGPKVSA